jgi:hypothetical protein
VGQSALEMLQGCWKLTLRGDGVEEEYDLMAWG